MKTQIRLLLEEQSVQGLDCLMLELLSLSLRVFTAKLLGVVMYR